MLPFETYSYRNIVLIIVAISWDFSLFWKIEKVVNGSEELIIGTMHIYSESRNMGWCMGKLCLSFPATSKLVISLKWNLKWNVKLVVIDVYHLYLIFGFFFKKCILHFWKIKTLSNVIYNLQVWTIFLINN